METRHNPFLVDSEATHIAIILNENFSFRYGQQQQRQPRFYSDN